jgi:3-oxoadipate enol-lactonase
MPVRAHDLILLHGQPGLGSDWRRLTARLPSGIRTLAPDRPGYGANPRPAGDLADGVRAVLAELDSQGIERAVIAGHSYGGGVALATAALAPDRVEALILLASVGPRCLTTLDWVLAAPVIGPASSIGMFSLTPWIARSALRVLARWRAADFDPHRYPSWYVWGHSASEHASLWRVFLAEQRALVRQAGSFSEMAGRVTAPTLIIADPRDAVVPVRTAKALHKLMPQSRLLLVRGPGHHLPMRAADLIAREITEFLTAVDSGIAITGDATASC